VYGTKQINADRKKKNGCTRTRYIFLHFLQALSVHIG
jgi:hypothetical protein